ncbi:MAG: hypothetical protein WCX27_00645 [Candidatus Paceibacterota bacterium]|jgi:hypothetical protein
MEITQTVQETMCRVCGFYFPETDKGLCMIVMSDGGYTSKVSAPGGVGKKGESPERVLMTRFYDQTKLRPFHNNKNPLVSVGIHAEGLAKSFLVMGVIGSMKEPNNKNDLREIRPIELELEKAAERLVQEDLKGFENALSEKMSDNDFRHEHAGIYQKVLQILNTRGV